MTKEDFDRKIENMVSVGVINYDQIFYAAKIAHDFLTSETTYDIGGVRLKKTLIAKNNVNIKLQN